MHCAVRNADKGGNVAVQIQQRVHLNGALVLRNFAHGNKERHRSMVVESSAYKPDPTPHRSDQTHTAVARFGSGPVRSWRRFSSHANRWRRPEWNALLGAKPIW